MTVVLVAGAFISVLNQTIVSPALPGIMSELGVDVSMAQWLITIFTLVMAIMIPVTAFLLDRFSLRSLFISAMALFAAGSLLLAWGPTFSVLILGRVLQAISSGMLSPMIMSILMWIFPLGFRGRAMGLYSLVIAFAPAIGPTYSGVIVDMKSERNENLSRRNAVTGIMIAITSVNMVMSHWAIDTSTPSSDMMPGSAGETIVWFKTEMKAPATRTTVITICLLVS